MERLPFPSTVEYRPGADESSGTLVIEPLYPGYGTTLGNALRRVLLSSLPGAAVTAVKIANAPHEFTTLPKVQEDVLQIILNLKQLRLRVFGNEPVTLHLTAKGERVARASDIVADSQVAIVNPDLPIATLTARNAELTMDITVSQGRGYVPTEAREKEKLDIGTIAVDALFSPVRQVAFRVEPTRVGQMTNFDKLVLTVTTDGTIAAAAAVREAAALLLEHLTLVTEALGSAAATTVVGETTGEDTGAEKEKPSKKKRTRKSAAE
jgi:DNA-directed RNA polymerase subunit alpha